MIDLVNKLSDQNVRQGTLKLRVCPSTGMPRCRRRSRAPSLPRRRRNRGVARRQELEEGEDDCYSFGIAAMQGWRTEMVRAPPPPAHGVLPSAASRQVPRAGQLYERAGMLL